jgi:hypothetical protein
MPTARLCRVASRSEAKLAEALIFPFRTATVGKNTSGNQLGFYPRSIEALIMSHNDAGLRLPLGLPGSRGHSVEVRRPPETTVVCSQRRSGPK